MILQRITGKEQSTRRSIVAPVLAVTFYITLIGCQVSRSVSAIEPASQPLNIQVAPAKPTTEMATLITEKGERQVNL